MLGRTELRRPAGRAVGLLRLDALRWLPVPAAVAYLATVAVLAAGLIRHLYWDSDAASPLVLAERLRGHGAVLIPHIGSWTALWWMLATRSLPGHAQLWEATGYVFAVATAALVGYGTARVAGTWAGATAAGTALVVGPVALRSLLTLTYHVVPPFTAALLGAYLVLLPRRRSLALAAAVGLVAGANAASDPLSWLAAVAPFALAAVVLWSATRRADVAARATLTLATCVGAAVATSVAMRSLGFSVVGLGIHAASPADLLGNAVDFVRMAALLGGANYALPGGYPAEPLRALLALAVLAALVSCVVAAVRLLRRRSDPVRRAYACYWAAAIVLLAVAFVTTTNASDLGAGSVNYLLTLAPAAGVGVALLSAESQRFRPIVALTVAAAGAVNIAGLVAGRAEAAPGAVGRSAGPLAHLLERRGVTRGYAGYWDAANLAWQSGGRLSVTPVEGCGGPSRRLCGSTFFTIRSWFEPRPGPSFLIVDRTTPFATRPPAVASAASARYRLGPLTVYLFPYDLARRVVPPRP